MKKLVTVLICLFSISFAADKTVMKMSTTTSTENSGLLKYLLPEFYKEKNIDIQVIAVGSGKALQLAENGDVDLVFSHAPKDEAALVSKGAGVDYWKVMYNDFVIVGPSRDSAGIGKVNGVVAAFKKIASSQAIFVSRGDESGTHKKEKEIWVAASIVPSGKWYMSAGQGMEACLIMANEKPGYILTDRGTFLSIADKVKLTVISEGDSLMKNQYGIMAVNPEKHKHVKYKEAKAFIDWIISEKGQELIASFTVDGMQLFFPNASK
ncbi:MAG: substrate-binding domain-containing protein [Fibrobacterota bacterium]|nr:substrate-binding domain-containing protein [Chitinispirillaceae bacterium]